MKSGPCHPLGVGDSSDGGRLGRRSEGQGPVGHSRNCPRLGPLASPLGARRKVGTAAAEARRWWLGARDPPRPWRCPMGADADPTVHVRLLELVGPWRCKQTPIQPSPQDCSNWSVHANGSSLPR
jgi:hypothetical protein